MTTHMKRLTAGASTAVLLAALVTGCSSGASIEEFCAQNDALDNSSPLDDVDFDDSEAVNKAADEMISQIKSIDAPDEIADDWDTVTDAMEDYLAATKNAALNPETAADDMQAASDLLNSEEVNTAGDNVEAFTKENCEA